MNQYSNIEEIGKGSFGTAFRATRNSDNKTVVIKRIPVHNKFTRDEAIKEVNILKSLSITCM